MRCIIVALVVLLGSECWAAEVLWQEENTRDFLSASSDPQAVGNVSLFPISAVNTSSPDIEWNVPQFPFVTLNGPRLNYYVDSATSAAQGFNWQSLVDYLAVAQPRQIEACFGNCSFSGPPTQGPVVPGRLDYTVLSYTVVRSGALWRHRVNLAGRLFDDTGGPYPSYHRTTPEPSTAILAGIALCGLSSLRRRHH